MTREQLVACPSLPRTVTTDDDAQPLTPRQTYFDGFNSLTAFGYSQAAFFEAHSPGISDALCAWAAAMGHAVNVAKQYDSTTGEPSTVVQVTVKAGPYITAHKRGEP